MSGVKIIISDLRLEAELLKTETASKVLSALPIESKVNRWGDEIYFSVPVKAGLESNAKDILEIGDVCYWTTGQAIAIFFGPTPVSEGNECRAYEPVNLFGKIKGDAKLLKKIKEGETIRLEKI